MKKYYTIFLGVNMWENIIDDMNTTEVWAKGGMLWKNKKKALACMKNLQKYDFETKSKRFSIIELKAK